MKKSYRKRFLPEFRPVYYRVVMGRHTKREPVIVLQIRDIRYDTQVIEIEVVKP